VAEFDRIDPVPCPCGEARRAFALPENEVATLHRTDISADSRAHYHKTLTEIYYVLEGEGYLELDGDRVSLQPGTAVFIPPLTRHRAVGKLRVLIVAVPTFDPNDEWFDDED
jgi:mannose-6-phosphate isomerase-like protein (cupin superfamily)